MQYTPRHDTLTLSAVTHPTPPVTQHAAPRRWLFVLIATLLVLAAAGTAWWLTRPEPPVEKSSTVTTAAAITACEDAVKLQLKAPGTAKFGDQFVRDGTPAEVIGWVDSENGFGALVRNRFLCLAHKGQTGWRISEVTFSDWP